MVGCGQKDCSNDQPHVLRSSTSHFNFSKALLGANRKSSFSFHHRTLHPIVLLDRLGDSNSQKYEHNIDKLVDAIGHNKVNCMTERLSRCQRLILSHFVVGVLHHKNAKSPSTAEVHQGDQIFEDLLVIFEKMGRFFRKKVANQEKDQRRENLSHIESPLVDLGGVNLEEVANKDGRGINYHECKN